MDASSRVCFAAVALLLLVLVAVHPSGVGQSSEEPDVRVVDALNDVRIRQGQNDAGPAPNSHPHLDLVEGWISNETVSTFEVGYRLQTWNDPFNAHGITSRFVQLVFVFGEVSYVVTHGPGVDSTTEPQNPCWPEKAAFGPGTEGGFFPTKHCLEVTVEEEAGTAHVVIPKELLESSTFLKPQVGDVLSGFFATTTQLTGFGYAEDRAPDEGGAPDAFRFRRGVAERGGDLFLRTNVPLRASNGESTTMVFDLELGNEGDADRSVTLTAVENNPGWTVRLPGRVVVPADGSMHVPAILSMEFSHDHAKTEFFRVRAEALDDEKNWAEIELGVSWLAVPQPAGHHDRLWLHSWRYRDDVATVPGNQDVLGVTRDWMNAVEKDPDPTATDEPVPGQRGPAGPIQPYFDTGTLTRWEFPLSPSLQIGLDPDTTRIGSFVTELFVYAPATSAELDVQVRYCDPAGEIPGEPTAACGKSGTPASYVTILSGSSGSRSLPANSATSYVVELQPNASAEILPYNAGSTLTLFVQLKTETPQSTHMAGGPPMPTLDPKKSLLTLPLHEYHDPIDQTFLSVGSVSLEALDPFDKRVNPGRGSVFRYDLTNSGDNAHTMTLFPEGINSAWARVHEGTQIVVPPHETKQVSLIVQAPDDAVAGERAELFLVAESQEDPNVVALGRVRVTVIELDVLDIPDEAASLSPASQNGSTAGFGAFAALAAAAIVVSALPSRRRR